MKRQQAFGGSEKMLKGSLHIHSTLSDGRNTPDEVVRGFCTLGYDFLALTEHNRYNLYHPSPEVPITVIPGMEFNTYDLENEGFGFRCYHSGVLGPLEEDGNGFRQDEYIPALRERSSEQDYLNYMEQFREKGNFTIINHPQWCSLTADYLSRRDGDIGVEVWNTGVVNANDCDKDAFMWDAMLGMGKRIYGIATDDSHYAWDWGHGWVMVRSENTVRGILEALKNGAFYSSCGPEIYDFYVEDDVAVVECSEAAKICFLSDMHLTYTCRSAGGNRTRAEYDMKNFRTSGGYNTYIRATVTDAQGRQAWTNPIFFDHRG